MAYKFQVGAAILSGSITHKESATFQSGLNANEQNILNVGTIRADILQSDANELDIVLADDQASALEIKEGSNVYQKFVTSDGAEAIEFMKPTDFGNQISANMNIDSGDIASSVVVNKSPVVNFNSGDVQGSITLTNLASGTGGLTIQPNSVEDSMVNDNVATGLAGNGLAASSGVLAVQVSGAVKLAGDKLGLSGSIAGSGLAALGGADSISELVVDIGGLAELAHADIADADEMMIDDSGTLKKVGVDSIRDHFFGVVSGDAAIADGGAVTMASAQTNISSIKHASLIIGAASGNDHIDFSAGGTVAIDTNNVARLSVTDATSTFSNDLVVAGNLTVQGTTTTVDSTTINISSSFTFEGPADDHETSLSVGTPIQDIDIVMPEYSSSAGAHQVKMAVLASGGSASDYLAASLVQPSEFALLDGASSPGTTAFADGHGLMHNAGGTMRQTTALKLAEYILPKITGGDVVVSSGGAATIQAGAVESGMLNPNVISGQTELASADIADADEMLINDNGALKRVGVDSLRSFINAGGTPTAFGDANATLAVGLNYASANTSQARTLTLPASSGVAVGQKVRVKVAGVSSGAVTIQRAGSQTIDGNLTSVVLESDNSAIELVYVDSDDWRIF